MDVTESVDEALDPRIQIELENLNDATDDINKLETELDEAQTAFRQLLCETTKRLTEILNKVGNSCVEKARCYYEALEVAREAQIKCQQQAQLFQRASEIHAAAKETVTLAESRFMSHQHEWNFDQAWQDMLNHATLKVMDAENQKAECGREHYRRAVLFHDAEKRLLQLEEKHRRAIIKARPYFEVKTQCDQMLATQKERVEYLQKAIQDAKTNYASSLRRLEEISNQIHQQRRDYDFIANGPREPGVGAELVSPRKTSNYDIEFNQLNGNKIKDITSNQLNKFNRIQDYDNTCQLQEDTEHLGKRSVDGSEATSSQWELELEVNTENINNLSLENSVHDHDSKTGSISNLHFYNEENSKSNAFLSELSYNSLQTRDYSTQNLNQSKKMSKNFQISKNQFINMPLMTHAEESNAVKNEITNSAMLNEDKINFKNNISKSLNNSPTKTNVFNLRSVFAEKGLRKSITKYVPNNVFSFGFSNNKSQSSNDINLSSNLDTNTIEKYQSLDDIIGDKTDNLEFDKQVINLKYNTRSFTMKETYDNGLNAAKNLYSAQLSNFDRINLESKPEIIPEKNGFKSKSIQFLSFSASTSPVKVKKLTSLSNENFLNRKLFGDSNKSSVEKFIEKPLNIKELPLLSLFEKVNLLADSKNKSCSMINLADKRNFVSLDDLHLNNTKTSSTERLTSLKSYLFLKTIN
ncbi:SH3 domain-binding protein 5 like protein [Habropoda laboriosa]|uniref:SH3 domain-binding protein 5 like protein n=1 Tax=Habropoda laboriosa TaxID=597456 RepID=A0A0L7REQ8_9HYME|nr:SH3 domain-binding protein 5 like protein [Habropoda laboriosa]